MVFKFENAKDRDLVLQNGPYATYGAPWMMKEMSPYLKFDEKCFCEVPTWVKFLNLLLECWGDEGLSTLTSFVAKPLETEHFTGERNKPSYVRVLVEVDATKPLMREISFQLLDGEVVQQQVIYETEPKVCMKCRRFGHDGENCKGNKPNTRARSKSRQRWQVKQHDEPRSVEKQQQPRGGRNLGLG